MPQISIIMPTYDRAWIIERAIDSVMRQTFGDFELIIIDDGSTDNTLEVIYHFDDPRIVVLQADHKGASAARNQGIAQARGEFIAYLDTDNMWHDKFLEVMIGEFNPEDQMLYCGQNLLYVEKVSESLKLKVLGRKTRTPEFNPDALLKGNYIDINCVVQRGSLIKEVGTFNEDLKALEDWELFARVAVAHPFEVRYIDQVLCDYYFFGKGSSETITNQNFHDSVVRVFGLDEDDRHTVQVRALIATERDKELQVHSKM